MNDQTGESAAADDHLGEYKQDLPEPEVDPNPDHAWKALSNVNDWIKHAETKTSITLAGAAASGVMLYNLVKDVTKPDCALRLFVFLAGAALLACALSGVLAILPRLTLDPRKWPVFKKAEQDLSSLLFFSHVAKKYTGQEGSPSFVEVFRTLTSDNDHLTRQIAQQVHANATVAHRKYNAANVAVITLAIDYICLAVVASLVGWN